MKNLHSNLAFRLSVMIAAAFVALVGAVYCVLALAVMPRFERIEADSHARNEASVVEHLTGVYADMRARALDYGRWTDTYQFARGRYPGYPEDNFDAGWFQRYGADLLVFVDAEGKILWSGVRLPGSAQIVQAPRVFEGLAVSQRRIGEPPNAVLWTRAGVFAYATAPITRSDGAGAPAGLVIVGRALSPADMARATQLNIAVVGREDRALAPHLSALDRAPSTRWFTRDEKHVLVALRDARGEFAGAIHARAPRRIVALGESAVNLAIGAIAVAAGVVLLLAWLAFDLLVVRRLRRMETHLATQSGGALEALPATRSRDEVGRLTEAYNALAARLNAAQASEAAARLAEEIAIAESRTRSAFMANVSHELRTPLNAIIGYAELLSEQLEENGQPAEQGDADRIRASAQQLLHMVNTVIDLSRIEAGQVALLPESFSVAELLQEAVDGLDALARQRKVALSLSCAPACGMAYTDAARLRQCLHVVLENACKFTEHGSVRVQAGRARRGLNEVIVVSIADTGVGIEAAQHETIFRPFGVGAGANLAITRKLLRLMGGDISVESAPGRGAVFQLSFAVSLVETAEAKDAA